MSNQRALSGYQLDDDKPAFKDLLWEAHEVLACLSALVQHSNGSDIDLNMDDSARKGLGRILLHCSQITIDAIGIAPSAKQKEAEHE